MKELLERTLKVLTGEGTLGAYIKALVSDIETELAKPVEPVLLVNVWNDKNLPCFNVEWLSFPSNWGVGSYKLYTHPPAQKHTPTTEPCLHENNDVGWDHVTCLDCGWVNKGPVIGPNNGWFPSLAAQEEFKKYNTYPGIHDIKPTRKIKAK